MSISTFVTPSYDHSVTQYLPRNLSNISDKSASRIAKELQKVRMPTRRMPTILKAKKQYLRRNSGDFDRFRRPRPLPNRRKQIKKAQPSPQRPAAEPDDDECICEQQKNSLTKFCPKCIKVMMQSVLPTNANNYVTEEEPTPTVENQMDKEKPAALFLPENPRLSAQHRSASSVSDVSQDSGIASSPCQLPTEFYIDTFSGEANLSDLEEETHPCSLERDGEGKCACTECLQKDLTSAMEELDRLALPNDEEQEYAPKLRKVSSLKTTKTPPGERSQKKVVRFADAFGFDLQTVRPIFNRDAPPVIPISATSDLHLIRGITAAHDELTFEQPPEPVYITELLPSFSLSKDLTRLWHQKVILQDVSVDCLIVKGIIKVANLAFEKMVTIRYSVDRWRGYNDVNASYVVQGARDGVTDLFNFTIFAPVFFKPGDLLSFAICYCVQGQQFWDNNDGKNYNLRAISRPEFTESTGAANIY